MVLHYWQVGRRIRTDILESKRAAYGEEIVSTLSRQLSAEFGSGYSRPNLFRMIRFAEFFADGEIVSTLSRQLSWSHFVEILQLKDPLQRDFYAEMCRIERWNVRTLQGENRRDALRADGAVEEARGAGQAGTGQAPGRGHAHAGPGVSRSVLPGLSGSEGAYSEKDLETAILREMEQFILELGAGFTFVARQKRIVIDGEDFYLDLLFYHRKLRRLIAVELKLERSRPPTRGRWSFTSAGWKSTRWSRGRRPRSG